MGDGREWFQEQMDEELELDQKSRPCDGSHYDTYYKGHKIDPYLVAKIWGITDPALFHILKTVARAGRKQGNTLEREYDSILFTITRAIEIEQEIGRTKEES